MVASPPGHVTARQPTSPPAVTRSRVLMPYRLRIAVVSALPLISPSVWVSVGCQTSPSKRAGRPHRKQIDLRRLRNGKCIGRPLQDLARALGPTYGVCSQVVVMADSTRGATPTCLDLHTPKCEIARVN